MLATMAGTACLLMALVLLAAAFGNGIAGDTEKAWKQLNLVLAFAVSMFCFFLLA